MTPPRAKAAPLTRPASALPTLSVSGLKAAFRAISERRSASERSTSPKLRPLSARSTKDWDSALEKRAPALETSASCASSGRVSASMVTVRVGVRSSGIWGER